MEYRIRFCRSEDHSEILRMNKQSNLFATAQFLTGPTSITKTMESRRHLFLVAEKPDEFLNDTTFTPDNMSGIRPESLCVGYILAKMQAPGVCFNLLLTVEKEHRRRGIGGALIIALLKLLSVKDTPWTSHVWTADIPSYNVEALKMYEALHFDVEGRKRKATRAKTDLYWMAFHLDERSIPEYGKHVHNPAVILDDTLVAEFMAKQDGNVVSNQQTLLDTK